MKRILLLTIMLPFIVKAQNKNLVIEGNSPAFYLLHTVAAKENYYSIGRLYNISPKEIAPFNNLLLEKGLSLNQQIKIPLAATNFSQDGVVAADEVLVPLYHIVKEKEGLYRISTNYNKIAVDVLKKWNAISTDALSNGTPIIVGYLKVKKELSAFSGKAKAVTPVAAVKEPEARPVAVKETTPVAVVDKEPVQKEAKRKEPLHNADGESLKPDVHPDLEVKPVAEKPAPVMASHNNSTGGYFKNVFGAQGNESTMSKESGTAAVFKSTSGWGDTKYYCLHNSAAPGSVLKITNSANGKSVYAKVLDVMPDIKLNSGLVIRVSNAAAAELGAEEGKFDCVLQYSK